ncbi:hypothetical protein QJS10_CPA01g01300 [Acorus calamus]|uniref:PWWP domain-containing protein n=1 Tax=Acorus calamus TaxID=4465 RepID=A0AAV9FGP2_ACOCL|nr:hypothetical protein QJS10_CPA01g01300 [Acorus calamus]
METLETLPEPPQPPPPMAAETHNNPPSVAAVVEEATENGKLSGSLLEDGTLKPKSGHIQVVLIDESREGGVNGSDSTPPGENGTIGEGPEAPVTVEVATTVEIDGGDVFVPGDLVWGENKSHQWLPGRVHDCSDASEHAETVRRDHGGRGPRLLVAYFDGTFAWYDHPSQQLKPFAEEFVRMSRQGDSKRFAKALDVALEDIARSVESEMSCACMPEVPKSMVRNAGIREGSVVVPYSRIDVGSFDSDGFLTKLRAVACDVSLCDGVEAAVLRGKVMAFYCHLGFGRLTAYGRSQGVMDKRKDRSMAELMAEMDVEHGNNTKEDSSDGPTSPMKKKWKKKEKEEAKELEMMGIEGGGGGGDDGEIGSSGLRKRKPSKYLSYPYTNVDHYNNKRWIPGGDDSEGEEEKKPKKGMKVSSPSSVSPRMEGQITGASPFVKCSGELLQKKSRKGQKTDGVSGGDVFGVSEEDWGSVDKMLIKMRSTALNVRYLMRDSASESVRDSLRNSGAWLTVRAQILGRTREVFLVCLVRRRVHLHPQRKCRTRKVFRACWVRRGVHLLPQRRRRTRKVLPTCPLRRRGVHLLPQIRCRTRKVLPACPLRRRGVHLLPQRKLRWKTM